MKNIARDDINLLRHNARGLVRELGLLNDAYFDIGVTLAERHLLIELNTPINPTANEIAERLLLDKSTVSRVINNAINKSYVSYRTDENDKRKRYLYLTDKGKEILNAFEPIAFNQTKNALLDLTDEEVQIVFRGIALYEQGLKNARLRNISNNPSLTYQDPTHPIQMENLQDISEKLDGLGYILRPFKERDKDSLYEIFKDVVNTGSQFPYECSSIEEFNRQFFKPDAKVYVCLSSAKEVVGGFYIRPNYTGRSSHIANAAYMIRDTYRGKGIGSLMIKASLHLAQQLGFRGMQFNMVLSQNSGAVKLYQKLGFNIIGTLPEAVRNPDGSYQDGYVMYRRL